MKPLTMGKKPAVTIAEFKLGGKPPAPAADDEDDAGGPMDASGEAETSAMRDLRAALTSNGPDGVAKAVKALKAFLEACGATGGGYEGE